MWEFQRFAYILPFEIALIFEMRHNISGDWREPLYWLILIYHNINQLQNRPCVGIFSKMKAKLKIYWLSQDILLHVLLRIFSKLFPCHSYDTLPQLIIGIDFLQNRSIIPVVDEHLSDVIGASCFEFYFVYVNILYHQNNGRGVGLYFRDILILYFQEKFVLRDGGEENFIMLYCQPTVSILFFTHLFSWFYIGII